MSFYTFENHLDNPDNPGVKDVLPEHVLENKDQVELIDVRRDDEFIGNLGHAPGAKLITLDTLSDHLGSIPKNKTVVFICRSGGRSGKATAFAKENGYENVYNMKGGMLLWNDKGLTVER